ncbi:PucR family transcriptional regulator [Bounagaea algeriensis]
MTADSTFRLVDLLADQQLGLELLTEGDPDTPVGGAHAIEIENPSRWLKAGWLMLTTGTRFAGPAGTAEQQRALIRELHGAGVAALGFGVGISMETVPAALLDEARRRGFPVLAVPLATPFADVVDVVHQAALTKDVSRSRRTVNIQDYLLESLTARDALGTLVHRLGELLRGTVVLYDQSGATVASSGVGPTRIIRSEIAAQPGRRRRFTVGRWHVLTDPVRVDTVLHWLAVASRRRAVSEELAEPAVEAARRVITMIVRSRESVRAEDRLRRAELLRQITAEKPPDGQYLWDRLEMYRFRRGCELRLLMLTDAAWEEEDAESVQRAEPMERAALDADLRLLVSGYGQRVLGLAEAEDAVLRDWLGALPATVHCGMSEAFSDPAGGAMRLREAEIALAAAVRRGCAEVRFEEIGLVDWLIAGREESSVRAKAQEVLAPIVGNDSLMRALAEYFRCDCDVQRTAHKLGLHPNSVRYRLKRATAKVGCDLHSPADLAELSLSVRLLEEQTGWSAPP